MLLKSKFHLLTAALTPYCSLLASTMSPRAKSTRSQKKTANQPAPPPLTQPPPSTTSIRPTPRKKTAPAPPTPQEALLNEFNNTYDGLVGIKDAMIAGDESAQVILGQNFDNGLVSVLTFLHSFS
jgi:hypothetical protein